MVRLSDKQTIKDMVESNMLGAEEGLKLEVEKVMHIREQRGEGEWFLLLLEGSCPKNYPKLWLFFKCMNSEFDIRVYWVPDGFQTPRTRGDLVNDGCLWLFKEPNDLSNFRPCELEFTSWIDQDTINGITKFDVRMGAVRGEYRETRSPADRIDPQPATVVEYCASTAEVEDSELLVLEVGGLNEYGEQLDEGGIVHFFLGAPIASCDIEFV